MSNPRPLLIGGAALVKGSVRAAGPVMVELCNEWGEALTSCGYLEHAPFKTVHLIIRYGTQESEAPEIARIDGRHQELPVAYELPMGLLRRADRQELKRQFGRVVRATIERVASLYDLPLPPLS